MSDDATTYATLVACAILGVLLWWDARDKQRELDESRRRGFPVEPKRREGEG